MIDDDVIVIRPWEISMAAARSRASITSSVSEPRALDAARQLVGGRGKNKYPRNVIGQQRSQWKQPPANPRRTRCPFPLRERFGLVLLASHRGSRKPPPILEVHRRRVIFQSAFA